MSISDLRSLISDQFQIFDLRSKIDLKSEI